MSKLYTSKEIDNLARLYRSIDGGEVHEELEPGGLGWGVTVMTAPGKKTAVITEKVLNQYETAHTVRFYNRTPRKYADMIAKSDDID